MVKNDRQNWGWRWIWYSVMAFSYWVMFILFNTLGANPAWLIFAAYWSALAIVFYVQGQRWKPINERRQMAAYWGFASRVPLAQPHPLPNVGALPLPFIITLKPNWPKFLAGLGFLAGGALTALAILYPEFGEQGILSLDPFVVIFTLIMMCMVSPLIVLWLRSQQIAVTQEGLLVRHTIGWLPTTERIGWSDARLFAIRDGEPGTPATHYELSGPYAVVRWTRARNHWWSLHRPAISYAEYDAQMEALISLVSGITGLPLYDVRADVLPVPSPQTDSTITNSSIRK